MSAQDALGLRGGTVEVVPYDPRWPILFERSSEELLSTLGQSVLGIHHIGSTSVPGLCAKPILDVLVSIPDFDRLSAFLPDLNSLGYEHRPNDEVPDRHFFRRRRGTVRTHHLSLAESSSRHHAVSLAFRDALRSDPNLAGEYAELKLRLAQEFPLDRPAYMEGKSQFIEEVLGRSGLG